MNHQQPRSNRNNPRIPSPPCAFCNQPHWNSQCTQYVTPEAKRNRAISLHLCLKCLKSGHTTAQCRRTNCPKCNRPHDSALCNPAKAIQRQHTMALAAPEKEEEKSPTEDIEGKTKKDHKEETLAPAVLMSTEKFMSVSPCIVFNLIKFLILKHQE